MEKNFNEEIPMNQFQFDLSEAEELGEIESP